MAAEENQRDGIFIDSQIQNKFVIRFCSLVLLTFIVITAVLYQQLLGADITAFVNARLVVMNASDFVLHILSGMGLIAVVIVTAIALIMAVSFSHKFVGPLMNIRKHLHEASQGKFKRTVHLRSKDELKDLADSVNVMFYETQNKIEHLKKEVELFDKDIEYLKEHLDEDKIFGLKRRRDKILNIIKTFE